MHKKMAHKEIPEQKDRSSPAPPVTSEQLEDLRNFVASLCNSLASHAGVLFNQITSDVKI